MIKKIQDTALSLIKFCRYGKVKTSVFLLVTLCGCLVSFLAGSSRQFSGRVGGSRETGVLPAAPSEATPSAALTATPSFLFPPIASYSDATASNAEIMRPDQLNLAYLYEEGEEDTAQPTKSMAGKLYEMLAAKDAQWISGIYDLYNYTPEQAALLMELPVEAVTGSFGVIQDFKNIQVVFYNGDGQEISGTSNARSIISMANILHYYGVLDSIEDLEVYASQLWDASHSYSATMGNVYYCDGTCLMEGSAEDAAQESRAMAQSPSESLDSAGSVQETAAEEEWGRQTGTMESGSQGQASPSSGTGEQTSPSGGIQELENNTRGQASESGNDAGPGATGSGSPGPAGLVDGGGGYSDGQGAGVSVECPGHVDLSVYITVKGLSEDANLYDSDLVQSSFSESGGNWGGWNETAKGWVELLIGQDWYQQYGINTADLLISNPLTSAEIDLYMKMLPPDASPSRKAFVKYALASVGKVPYYWGGKPAAPGYTGNDFGSVVAPDEDGRFLRGLDCSGWVNWVYWSVTGRGLGAESTSTLIGSGKAIAKSDLIPGDICIRTGPMGHVVIFLGWTQDGKMLCIQETTGNSHNVEIGIVASDWNSYRRIID